MHTNAGARQKYLYYEQDSNVHPAQHVERPEALDDPKPKKANQEEKGKSAQETARQSHAFGR